MCSLFAESDLFGMMMGIAESFLSLGWIVGPLVGGYLADLAGFAAPFILTAALAFLSAPVLAFLMPPGKLYNGALPDHLHFQIHKPMAHPLASAEHSMQHQIIRCARSSLALMPCAWDLAACHSVIFLEGQYLTE